MIFKKERAKKVQNVKKLLCLNQISYDCRLWYTFVKWEYLQAFFFFFKTLISRIIRGVKGQKMTKNDIKFCCATYLRDHTSYDCHLWYIHICKMILSPGVFFFNFSKFWFSRSWGRWKCKKWPKMSKKYVSHPIF